MISFFLGLGGRHGEGVWALGMGEFDAGVEKRYHSATFLVSVR